MRNVLGIILSNAALLHASGPPPPGPAKAGSPNIVLLITDD